MITRPGTEHCSQPISKRRKTNMKSTVDTSSALGVIDPESDIEGKIAVLDGEPYDAMLVFIDPTINVDKFFVLQLIECENGTHTVYSRWGRTGTSGQALEQEFEEFEDALQCFEDKFKEKTGLEWENRLDPTLGSKYRFIQQNFLAKQGGYVGGKWQYWVDDGVDGKVPGWYDYTPVGSMQVEQLYQENAINPRLMNRLVASGHWTYAVDLTQMIQTNVQHHNRTSRRIRRIAAVPENSGDGVKNDEGHQEQGEQEKQPGREFVLTVTADISGTAGGGNGPATFGVDYDEDGTGMATSLRECLQAEETTFRRACGEVVMSYIADNAQECFETITNLGRHDGEGKIELTGPARVNRSTGEVSFSFHEVVALGREDSDMLMEVMLDEIRNGGDTWACGDFGDIGRKNVNSNDWEYWLGTGRRCIVEVPIDGEIEIRMYLGINPDISTTAQT